MEILAKLPCCIKARIFLYMQHPVATIYRAVYLQPAWCRDAAYLLSHVESLEQAFLCGEYDEMKDVLIAIDEHFRLLKLDLPPGRRGALELPQRIERSMCSKARLYSQHYSAQREPLAMLDTFYK